MDMLKILLCDDDPFFLSVENTIIGDMIKKEGLDAVVSGMAGTAAQALTLIQNNPGDYLVFLDLDFGKNKPNGIDISALLKKSERKIRVVFTTNHYEMAMKVLKSGAEPFGFLEKGADTKQLAAGLLRYVHMALRLEDKEEKLQESESVRLNVGAGEVVELRISDILYLETNKNISHGITYHTINGSNITVIGTLEAQAKSLGENFLRVHRSFLAAKNQMLAMHDGWIMMSDRQEIPCSLGMRGEVKKWIQKK